MTYLLTIYGDDSWCIWMVDKNHLIYYKGSDISEHSSWSNSIPIENIAAWCSTVDDYFLIIPTVDVLTKEQADQHIFMELV